LGESRERERAEREGEQEFDPSHEALFLLHLVNMRQWM
jgi:hypothetical protein